MDDAAKKNAGGLRARFHKVNTVDVVASCLARELFLLDVGGRLPTVDKYVTAFDVSRGTVQKAIAVLEHSDAVRIEKRGVLGSFLSGKNETLLRSRAGWNTLSGAGGLPRTKRQEALASSFYALFEDAGVPFNLAYLQGARKRVAGLLDGQYDFVIASKSSADLLIGEYGLKVSIACELEPYSYLSGYTIVTRKGESIAKAKRIGIDPNSPDHVFIAGRVFDDHNTIKNTEMVNLHFTKMPTAIASGAIDAFVFNRDVVDFGFEGPPLTLHDVPIEFDLSDLTRAVVLTNCSNYMIDELLRKFLNPEKLAEIQREVLEGKRFPIL